jgi:hypothetical protein
MNALNVRDLRAGEGIRAETAAWMRITGEERPWVEPDEVEQCSVQAIIRIWRHMRRDLGGRAAQTSLTL